MDSSMRGRLSIVVLLPLALSACGSDSKSNQKPEPMTLDDQTATASSSAPETSTTSPPVAADPRVNGTYLRPGVQLKQLKGKAPAVVLLPDTGDSANAEAEARKLAALGIGTLVLK